MAAGSDRSGLGGEPAPAWLVYLPPAWLALVMLLTLRGLIGSWPVLNDHRLPDSIATFVYASMVAGAVTVLWGLYVLDLAIARSRRFPRHFVAWQAVFLVWLVARELYVLAAPDFVVTPLSLAWTAGEIAVGAFCIAVALRSQGAARFYADPEIGAPSTLRQAVAALLGLIVGAALGAVVGLLVGLLLSEATEMSCFEGACGYFTVLIGLVGLVLGTIGGGVLAVWRTRRRAAAPM